MCKAKIMTILACLLVLVMVIVHPTTAQQSSVFTLAIPTDTHRCKLSETTLWARNIKWSRLLGEDVGHALHNFSFNVSHCSGRCNFHMALEKVKSNPKLWPDAQFRKELINACEDDDTNCRKLMPCCVPKRHHCRDNHPTCVKLNIKERKIRVQFWDKKKKEVFSRFYKLVEPTHCECS